MSLPSQELLDGPVPRSVPQVFRRGPYAREKRNWAIALFIVALTSIALSTMQWVKVLSYYILPLAFLGHFGAALLFQAFLYLLAWRGNWGRFQLWRRGSYCKVKVTKVESLSASEVNGVIFTASLRITGKPEGEPPFGLQEVRAETPPFPVDRSKVLIKEGSTVTFLYDPGDRYSFQILEALGFVEDGGIVKTLRRPLPVWVVLGVLGTAAASAIWYWAAHYEILTAASGFWESVVVGGLLFGICVVGCFKAVIAKHYQHLSLPLKESLWLIAGGWISGSLALYLVLTLVNGVAVDAPVKQVTVTAVEVTQSTTNFVLRDYRLKYKESENGEELSVSLWPYQLPVQQFSQAELLIQTGRLGWPILIDVRFI